MMLTLKVKLVPTEDQFQSLEQTMESFNQACDFVANQAFKIGTASKVRLQPIVYREVRERFGLSAQLTIRAISKACEAYKLNRSVCPTFKPHGAVIYDERILGWKGLDVVSILTLKGRIRVPVVMGDYYRSRMDRIRGQSDLILVNGVFYLCVVVEVAEPEKIRPVRSLGIDLGIVNLAVDSDGESYSGDKVDKVRNRYAHLRQRLQSRGTKSAKKHLKRSSGKEHRFVTYTNHCISKRIVSKAKDTGRGVSVEELTGIRARTTVRKAQRRRQSSWAFHQLRAFIEYKAALNGIPVVAVDPRNTSKECPRCQHIDRRNRPTRDEFKCVRCGLAGPADHIAAINIAARASINEPIVAGTSFLGHLVPPQRQNP